MLVDLLNNLKIRDKFFLVMSLPVLLLLFFAASEIWHKWENLQEASSAKENLNAALHIAELVHELQLERGLSAGYGGSGGKQFGEALQQQRDRTDKRLVLLQEVARRKKMGGANTYATNGLDKLLDDLRRLSEARSSVDSKGSSGNSFQYYTDLNSNAIVLILCIGTRSSNAVLARHIQALGALLWLQEYSGLERGAMNGMLASGKVDTGTIRMIQDYAAKQRLMLRNFRRIASNTSQMALLDYKLSDPAVARVHNVRETTLARALKSNFLDSLQTLIGYGGLIHNFKNYVIRGKPEYRDRFNEYFLKVTKALGSYRQLSGLSNEELADLNIIESTFSRHHDLLNIAGEKWIKGGAVSDTDIAVRVDDGPALAAINHLQEIIIDANPGEWFNDATLRINLIKEVSNKIAGDIVAHTEQLAGKAYSQLFLYGSLTFLVLLFTALFTITAVRHLVKGITGISQALERVKESGDFDTRIVEHGEDEIDLMERAFNQLVKERAEINKKLERNRRVLT